MATSTDDILTVAQLKQELRIPESTTSQDDLLGRQISGGIRDHGSHTASRGICIAGSEYRDPNLRLPLSGIAGGSPFVIERRANETDKTQSPKPRIAYWTPLQI